MDGVLEKAEGAVVIGPVVIAMTVVAGEDSRRGGSDLVGARSVKAPRWRESSAISNGAIWETFSP